MGCDIDDLVSLADQLDDVSVHEHDQWTTYKVSGRTWGFLWPRTVTLGLRQTLAEQAALVGERPDVFEAQFTSARYGWVVVHLEGVERDELAELVFEAWRLTAPVALVEQRGERLPR